MVRRADGPGDVAAVQAQREALLTFIHNAALLHDTGKNAMLTIIETQHRPLTDDEFSIIRQHPAKGAEYLSIDPDLTCLLLGSETLRQTLRDIAGKRRIEIYYETYQKYFM